MSLSSERIEQLHSALISAFETNEPREDYFTRPWLARELARVVEQLPMTATLSKAERGRLQERVLDRALGLGPLEPLLADPAITEIMVNGNAEVFVERAGRLERVAAEFTGQEELRQVINRIVAPIGRRIDESQPLVDARLPDGSRVNAVIPPLSYRGPVLTIRRFPAQTYTLEHLVQSGTLSRPMAAFLAASVRARQNILISGSTGSGKTSLLNALAGAVGAGERLITIEDTVELRLNHPHLVSLEARQPNVEGVGEITIRALLKNALRMRPDRIIIGEVRGAEALDMLQAMNTGHPGSLTTIHANAPREALLRLETMALMAEVGLPLIAIRQHLNLAIHYVVQQERLPSGERKIVEIAEVAPSAEAGALPGVQPIFYYQVKQGFKAAGVLPARLASFDRAGIALEPEWFVC